ncbi:MAG: hypothetical protein K940chlam8_00695 [Chlamydiae bacterium]|nr:hypothetical protein [Chlamydiota bacterium]
MERVGKTEHTSIQSWGDLRYDEDDFFIQVFEKARQSTLELKEKVEKEGGVIAYFQHVYWYKEPSVQEPLTLWQKTRGFTWNFFSYVKSVAFLRSYSQNKGMSETYTRGTIGIRDLYKARLSFVNGINYTHQDVINVVKKISKAHGHLNIHYYYNETQGFARDMIQSSQHKLGYESKEVKYLVSHLRELLRCVGEKGLIRHYAHSQGALITVLAAQHLTPEEKAQIEIIAIGPGQLVFKEATGYKSVLNYVSAKDYPILLINPEARKVANSNDMHDEIIILEPHPDAQNYSYDHTLDGPTYLMVVAEEGEKFCFLHDRTYNRWMNNLSQTWNWFFGN